jgi:hypothetical protein
MNAANDNKPGHPPVRSLKLEFSRAADHRRIDALFDPAAKAEIDPHNYVVKRIDHHFRHAITTGGAAILSDQNGRVMTLTMAYRVHHTQSTANDNRAPDDFSHDVTELGTSLARLPGYNSAKLVVAALTLREWWHNPPRDCMIAEIKRDNIASLKTYIDGLHWKPVLDAPHSARLYDATDPTLVDDKDKGGGDPTADLSKAKSLWHRADDATVQQSARIILDFMAHGGLSDKSGHHIPVDFTALAREGLTTERLKAIAAGQMDRSTLKTHKSGPHPAP